MIDFIEDLLQYDGHTKRHFKGIHTENKRKFLYIRSRLNGAGITLKRGLLRNTSYKKIRKPMNHAVLHKMNVLV